MAGDPDFSIDATPNLQQLVEYFVELLTSPGAMQAYETSFMNALTKGARIAKGAEIQASTFLAGIVGDFLAGVEEQIEPIVGPFLQKLASHLLGVEVSVAELRQAAIAGGESTIGTAAAALAFKVLAAPEGAIEPGDEGARKMLATLAQLTFNGWFESTAVEMLVTLFPDMDSFESIAELPHELINALGLSRLARTGLRPLARIAIATPMEWKLNKSHRPTLLSPATAIRQFMRNKWDWPDVQEELARQGYSEERIDAILNEQRKFISVEDVGILKHRVGLDTFVPMDYLGDMGYALDDARALLTAIDARRLQSQEFAIGDAAVAAFVAGDIDETKFRSEIAKIQLPADDAAHFIRLGTTRRGFAVTPIADGEARQAVKLGLLAFGQYREYLKGRGFDEFGIATKELLLRAEMDAAATAEELKARQAADRLAEKAAADADRAARVAAKAVVDALPAFGEVRRAFVRGLVAIDRVEQAIRDAHPGISDADAGALAADAQSDRDAYVAQLAAREAAAKKHVDVTLPLATLERAVLEGINTIESYDAELLRRGYDVSDRRTLVALMRGRLDDQAAAAAAKVKAEARAKLKGVSLADAERAVRLGLRTPAELAAFLDAIETPEIEKALILDLLAADMQRDTDAAAKRDAADKAAAQRAINLPLRRRSVLAGVRSRDQYLADLTAAGVSLDDRTLELQLLDVEIGDAKAAAARRAKVEADRAAKERAAAEPSLTLAQTEAAVKLGVLAPADLRQYLTSRGYDAGDVETVVATVVAAIPDLRQAGDVAGAIDQSKPPRELTLAQLQEAVRLGIVTLDDFGAELAARQYSDAAIATLVAELVATLPDVGAIAPAAPGAPAPATLRQIDLASLERAVLRGIRTLDDFGAELATRGYGEDTIALLTQLLAEKVAVELDALRAKVTTKLATVDGAPSVPEIDQAIRAATVDDASVEQFLISIGIARDVALVYSRLVRIVDDGAGAGGA